MTDPDDNTTTKQQADFSPSLPWCGYLLFLVACICIGALCWTMGA